MSTRFKLVLGWLCVLCLTACDTTEPEITAPAAQTAIEPLTETRQEKTARLWSASCALCHVTGIGGAPHIGQADEWQARLAQGEEVLMRHTLEGLNNMPPLGYCMACEREDFTAMIEFMTAGIPIPTAEEGSP